MARTKSKDKEYKLYCETLSAILSFLSYTQAKLFKFCSADSASYGLITQSSLAQWCGRGAPSVSDAANDQLIYAFQEIANENTTLTLQAFKQAIEKVFKRFLADSLLSETGNLFVTNVSTSIEKVLKYVYRDDKKNLPEINPPKVEYSKDRYIFLHLLNKCVQQACSALEISEYILKSKEMQYAHAPGTELHIVTNELHNYDFTTLASMAIAINVLGSPENSGQERTYAPKQRGTKYVFYCPADRRRDFDELKNIIKGYICKNIESKKAVDKWFRKYFSKRHGIMDWLKRAINSDEESFVKRFFYSGKESELIAVCKKYKTLFPRGGFTLPREVENWLSGLSFEEQSVYTFNNFLKELIATEPSCVKSIGGKTICNVATLINDFIRLSGWQLNGETLEREECENIFENIGIEEIGIGGHISGRPISDWLYSAAEEIWNDDDLAIIEEAVDNLVFITLPLGMSPIPSYNFCLFLTNIDSDDSCAWYVTSVPADEYGKNVDNTVFINEWEKVPRSIMDAFYEAYRILIKNNSEIKAELVKVSSKIIQRVGAVEGH